MGSYRCVYCNLNFPKRPAWDICPVCEDDGVYWVSSTDPDDTDYINRMVSFAEFERRFGPAQVD